MVLPIKFNLRPRLRAIWSLGNEKLVTKHSKEVFMTRNQIAYWELHETNRANKARETETNRNNVAVETETNRANLERERMNRVQSNRNYEVALRSLFEQRRATKVKEDQSQQQINETIRHDRQTESVAKQQADVSVRNVTVQEKAQAETRRANMQQEALNQRKQDEVERLNKTAQRLDAYRLNEVQRNNKFNNLMQFKTISETERSNRSNESIKRINNNINMRKLSEEVRHNKALEFETARHDLSQEAQGYAKLVVDTARSIFGTLGSLKLGGAR